MPTYKGERDHDRGPCGRCGAPNSRVACIWNGEPVFACDRCLEGPEFASKSGHAVQEKMAAAWQGKEPLNVSPEALRERMMILYDLREPFGAETWRRRDLAALSVLTCSQEGELAASGSHTTPPRTRNHWGVYVDLDKPVPGVIPLNELDGDFFDKVSEGIDLAWQEHVAECREAECSECDCKHTDEEGNDGCTCDDVEPHAYAARDHDFCGPQERGTVLAGGWVKDQASGKWAPDESGVWSAIVGEIYVQVVWSKTTKRCEPCSPCYPGQGNLDTPDEDGFLCFDLPEAYYR